MDFCFNLLFISCMWSLVVSENCTYCEQAVYKFLFKDNTDYDKEIRPSVNQAYVINVTVSVTITNILEINEKDEKMNIMGFISLDWQDIRLNWSPEDFGNVTFITVPALNVWLPDVIISNSATTFYESSYKKDFLVTITYDGSIYWEYGGIISTNCNIDMSEYPFDTQNCSLHLETWKYRITQLDLHLDEGSFVLMAPAKNNSLWKFNGQQAISTTVYNNGYRRLIFALSLKRRHLYYYFNLLIPAILMIWIALGVFWLPVESGEKVSLAITILLAFSVFLIIIMDNTPVNSLEIPVITAFVILLMCVTTLALSVAILLTYINACESRPPKWLRILCFKCLARAMCMNMQETTSDDDIENNNGRGQDGPLAYEMKDDVNNTESNSRTDTHLDQFGIKQISDDLKELLDYINTRIKSDDIKDEWIAIGKVIDRVFFWISFIILIVLLPLLLLRMI